MEKNLQSISALDKTYKSTTFLSTLTTLGKGAAMKTSTGLLGSISLPKKSNFEKFSTTEVQNIEDKLNKRPGKRHKYETPVFVMNQLLFNSKVAFIG